MSSNEHRFERLSRRFDQLTWCVENFLIGEIILCVRVEVPGKDWTVEPWRDQ